MTDIYSSFVKVFAAKINTIFAFGVVCFLGAGISALIISAYSDPSLLAIGIQTVNADVSESPAIVLPEQPVIAEQHIYVSLKDQTLVYMEGDKIVGEFRISSGLPATPTPPGEYSVLKKKPVVNYGGATYWLPNTKWNMMFKTGPLNYYIHGAYWHHNFGHAMSHGCINVAYVDMEGLYNWANEGTGITIIADALDTLPAMSSAVYPTPPGVLVASKVTGTSMMISWNTAADPSGVAGYQIYQDNVLIATTAEPKFDVSGLIPGVTYQFAVFAYNQTGGISFEPEKLNVTTAQQTGALRNKGLTGIIESGLVAGASITNPLAMPQSGDTDKAMSADAIQAETGRLMGSLKKGDIDETKSSIANLRNLLDVLEQGLKESP